MAALSSTVSAPELMPPKLRDRSLRSRSRSKIPFSVFCGQPSELPVLSCSEAIGRLEAKRKSWNGKQRYLAMYSSVFGGIVIDPAAMFLPVDDHMVHRGHGVFDTAAIMDGYLYELDQHVDRILRSASMAKIPIPFDRETMKGILIQTVGVSKCRKGSLRYWLSAGPGDFQLSPTGCSESALYAIVIQDESPFESRGIKVVTSSIPIKPPQFAKMKSVNYLPNALSKMEAEESKAYAAIWLDSEGFVAEGPNMNVAFVTGENELLMPHFEKILSGCTAKRVLTLAEKLVHEGKLKGILVGDVTVEQGKSAKEMMLIGSGVLVKAVVQWDDRVIGDGKEGPVAQALLEAIIEDMKSGPSSVRIQVSFTDSRDQGIGLMEMNQGYSRTAASDEQDRLTSYVPCGGIVRIPYHATSNRKLSPVVREELQVEIGNLRISSRLLQTIKFISKVSASGD